tara:strand:+ start:118 stop:642 length:525 start_codon:yes stop_codon:yes gene_type:complete
MNKNKKTSQQIITATVTSEICKDAGVEFMPEMAEMGATYRSMNDRLVDTVNEIGRSKNAYDPIFNLIVGDTTSKGSGALYLDYAQKMFEAGVDFTTFKNAFRDACDACDANGFNTVRIDGKKARGEKQDWSNTVRRIWKKDTPKGKGRTMEQLVASLVKQYGKKAVALAVEKAA